MLTAVGCNRPLNFIVRLSDFDDDDDDDDLFIYCLIKRRLITMTTLGVAYTGTRKDRLRTRRECQAYRPHT